MDAASAASARPSRKTSTKCSAAPAPPEAITGMLTALDHRPRQFAIEAVAHSIAVNRGEQYFARSALLRLASPFHRVASGRVPASCGFHSERHPVAVADAQSINGDDHCLRPIAVGNSADQRGIRQRRGIDRDFVCPGVKHGRGFDRANGCRRPP